MHWLLWHPLGHILQQLARVGVAHSRSSKSVVVESVLSQLVVQVQRARTLTKLPIKDSYGSQDPH